MTDEVIRQKLIEERRELHKRPEEGWTEFETTWHVVRELRALGYAVKVGLDVISPEAVMGRNPDLVEEAVSRALAAGVPQSFIDETGGYTGVVAEIDTGRPGPVTAYRADMDCVFVREQKLPGHAPAEKGFMSERPGFMHACGHDAHTALGLAAARWAMAHKDELCGKLKFIFQPAEEGVRGAAAMTAAGVVDDVDVIFGGHVGCSARSGEMRVQTGGCLATTKYDIDIEGEPSHAGSHPHLGKSALMAACSAAMMLQGIPRHGEGVSRIAVGKLIAGEGRNVTPAHAHMEIEVRGETKEVNEYMEAYVRNIFEGVERAYGVRAVITKAGAATTLPKCPEFCAQVEEVLRQVPGIKVLPADEAPSGSEDVSFMMRRVVERGGQAAFILYGCDHHGHHRPDFDVQDEKNLPAAFDFVRRMLLRVNGRMK